MLLAVPNALHFNFQCQNCGVVTNGALISTIVNNPVLGASPGQYALSFTCPNCAAVESFNSDLASADAQLAGPHGSQAQLIRQVQTILALQELG